MNLSFSIASAADIPAIVTVLNQSSQVLTQQYGKGHWNYQVNEKGIAYGMKANAKVLLVKQEEDIIGTLRLATKKPWAIDVSYFTPVEQPLYLVDMAVSPAWQRKGIGTYMLQQAKQIAIDWPAQSIRLDAYDHIA